jgi:hypothetical protein
MQSLQSCNCLFLFRPQSLLCLGRLQTFEKSLQFFLRCVRHKLQSTHCRKVAKQKHHERLMNNAFQ